MQSPKSESKEACNVTSERSPVWSKRFLISGGTGLIGTAICQKILESDGTATVLTRQHKKRHKNLRYVNDLAHVDAAEPFDFVINLAGEPIAARRWTANQKKRLVGSRVSTTSSLIEYLRRQEVLPKQFISASAIGYYGDGGDRMLSEENPHGNNFSSLLCREWENAASEAEQLGMPTTYARFAVVMSEFGGSWREFSKPLRFRVSPYFGRGSQWFSWIDLSDLVSALEFIFSRQLDGAINVSSPSPLQNRDFAGLLASRAHTVFSPSIPDAVLKVMLGEMANELLLLSQRVVPQALEQAGFVFQYETMEKTLDRLLT